MKKGFTLIELVVTMAIAAILLSFEVAVFTKHINDFQRSIEVNKQNSFCDEFFVIIEQLISENVSEIEVINNNIVIKCSNNQKKIIQYKSTSNKILVDYYDAVGNDFSAANVICSNIKEMTVKKKSEVLYVSIINNKGVQFERCFGIKKLYQ